MQLLGLSVSLIGQTAPGQTGILKLKRWGCDMNTPISTPSKKLTILMMITIGFASSFIAMAMHEGQLKVQDKEQQEQVKW